MDSVGGNTAYAALLPGGVTFGPGEVGQGFQLNDTNAYLVVPPSASLNVAAGGSLTAEAWVKVSDVINFHPIIEWNDGSNHGGVHLWILPYTGESGDVLFANVADTSGGSHSFHSPGGSVSANVFQHVALTYDHSSGMAVLYVNGNVVAQANFGPFSPQTSFPLFLGHRPNDNPQYATYGAYLGGVLDELSLYNRALSQSEIAAIYDAGALGKCTGTNSGVAPTITSQPTNQTVAAGGTASFSVTATGTLPLHYQWYGPGNTSIPGADSSTLTLSNVQPANAGAYYAFVTNSFGFAQSSNAVLTVTGGGATNSCTPPPSGLVGWWKGENNTLDSAGANNGLAVGGPVAYAAGEVGNAFHYSDSSGYVSVPAAASLDVGQGSGFTLEAWIQPADLQNQMPIFEWQYNTNNDFSGAHFWVSAIGGPGCLFANIMDSSNNAHWIYSAPGIITADYQHVALTYDKSSGVASIYRNGVLVAHENLGSFTPNTTGNLLLGERTYLGGQPQFHYLGGLDEMSVYDRALSQSEIVSIFNAGNAGKCGGGTSSGTAPVITSQPTNVTVAAGGVATFNATATGSQPLHFQWYGPSETVIAGATASTLTLSNVQPSAAGAYFVLVTNQFGFAISSNAILTVTGGTGGGSNTCTTAPSGLVSWWKGEGNALDSADGNNGTLVNGVGFAAGEVGQAFLFTHTNQDVLIPAASNLDVGLGDGLTLEAWIKPSDITNYDPVFEWNPGDGVTYWGVHLYVLPTGDANGPTGYLYSDVQEVGDTWHQIQTGQPVVAANTFQHVALTYDKASGVARLYLNGGIVAETVFGTFTPKTTGNLNIGNRPIDPAGSKFTFTGLIDEPSVYNRALGSNEVAAIFNAGANGKCEVTNSGTAPVITSQPTNQTVAAGGNATFTATATGSPTLHYQWYGPSQTLLAGATTSTLTLSNVQAGAAGAYYVFVTNQFGFAISSNATLTVTGGTIGGGTNSCTPPPSGIVAWWRAESNTVDSINGNDGTIHGGVTYVDNVVGHAFRFNGTDGYISVPASSSLNVGTGTGLSIECWIKPDHLGPIGAAGRPIVEYDTASSIGAHFWVEDQFRLYANIKDTTGADHQIISQPGVISTNSLSHVAVTYNKTNGNCFLYVNGVQVASNNFGNITPQTSYPLYIGLRAASGYPGTGSLYNGILDELSFYSRALSDGEIAAIYNAGANGKCPSSQTVQLATLNSQPTLNLSVVGNSRVLSWPLSAGNLILQSAASLTLPMNWTNVPVTPQTDGDNVEVVLPETSQQGYFRLVQP